MKQLLIEWCNSILNDDKTMKWEIIKFYIRQFTIKYSKSKKQERTRIQKSLERELCLLERDLNADSKIKRYNEVKIELKKIEDDIIKGQIIRSKVRWHEEGERNSKYFLGLEKNNSNKKTIRKLELSNGTISTNQEDIVNEQLNFYTKLYSSTQNVEHCNIDHLFDHVTKLDDTDKDSCDGAITVHECEYVLKTLKNNKTPGNDGLTSEFYKYFWNEIKGVLVESINYSYEENKLSSQKQAIITLIDKGKDRTRLDN